MGIHNGHRDRLKERFLTMGLDGFDDHQALELLLFYALPQQDTNPLAHELLSRFGSLAGVCDATPDQLCSVPGVGRHTAILLSLVPEFTRRYLLSQADGLGCLNTVEKIGAYLLPRFHGRHIEEAYLLCLDAKYKVLGCTRVSEGGPNFTHIDMRRVVETALHSKAVAVVLAHNHPSGVAVPSPEDHETTRALFRQLQVLGITLLDHIIVADADYVSMNQSGMLEHLA